MSTLGEGKYPSMTVSTPSLTPGQYPTPYEEVNSALETLLTGIRRALVDDFVGMYLYGSLATGDFNPHRSDIDVLIVTRNTLSAEQFAALAALHQRFAASESPWAAEIEVSYLPLDALPRFDPARTLFPRIDRGSGDLHLATHDVDSVINRHVLRERGIVLAGPALDTLIEPVSPDELRRATVELMHIWWGPMAHEASRLLWRGYQTYAVFTMCRVLFTLEHGAIISKPEAAHWAVSAHGQLGERFGGLIERALAWHKEEQEVLDDDVCETQALIAYTQGRCDTLRAPLEQTGFH